MRYNIHSCIEEFGVNSTGHESGTIGTSRQRLIRYLVRWWDCLARFTISGMISRILVEIWQSLSLLDFILLKPTLPCQFCSQSLDSSRSSCQEVYCPCLVVFLLMIPAPSLASISFSASSQIWILQFPPRSLNMFSHRLFRICWGPSHYSWLSGNDGLPEQPQAYSGHCWWYG